MSPFRATLYCPVCSKSFTNVHEDADEAENVVLNALYIHAASSGKACCDWSGFRSYARNDVHHVHNDWENRLWNRVKDIGYGGGVRIENLRLGAVFKVKQGRHYWYHSFF